MFINIRASNKGSRRLTITEKAPAIRPLNKYGNFQFTLETSGFKIYAKETVS